MKKNIKQIAYLTKLEGETLRAIEAHLKKHNYGPSLQDLADARGASVSLSHRLVESLERKGALKVQRNHNGRMVTRSFRPAEKR